MTRRRLILLFLTLFVWTVCPAMGATLENYRERVGRAHDNVNAMISMVEAAKTGGRDVSEFYINATRREIPSTEKVEWDGGSIETSNGWLDAELQRAIAETNLDKRSTILASVRERLAAIAKQVDDLQAATAARKSKDEERRKLGEILSRPEYQKAQPPEESLFQRWMRQFQEWLEKVFPRAPDMPASATGMGGLKFWLQILVYALVLGLIGFLLYKFVPYFSMRFGGEKRKGGGDRVILGERVAADMSAGDLFAEAEALALAGDLRGAIRKGYVALLCELSDRKVLGLARHKTNRDYLRDLRRRSDILPQVSGLTLSFERSWYGLRDADAQEWEEFRSQYREALGQVK